MALDGLLLHQLLKEMQASIPAKINKIQGLSDTELIFTIRTANGTQKLLISLHSVYNRINLTQETYTTMETPSNFIMLLRKQLDGGMIRSMEQIGLDRILHMVVESRNELGDLHNKHIYIELMGKYANFVLVDDQGKIIDALKRIPPFENNKRTIHPGAMYTLPPAHENKQDPYTATNVDFSLSLVKQFHGFSPLLASEVQHRMQNKESFASVMEEIKNSSNLYLYDHNDTLYYHCIPLRHLHLKERVYPLMKGMDLLYRQKEEQVRIKQQSKDLFLTVKKELHKNSSKLPKLIASRAEALDCEKYRLYGDLLFAYMHQVEKAPTITLPSFETGEDIVIPIDMRYDLKQNANRHYQKYHKQKRAQEILEEQIQKCKEQLDYFETIQLQLEQASIQDAMEIREELTRLGYVKARQEKIRKKKKKAKDVPNISVFQFGETFVYVGKNNIQNDFISFKLARKNDIWLHVKDLHGSHVVITCEHPDEQLLRDASMLAAYYSSGRYSSSVPVNYCYAKDIKKVPKAALGFAALGTYKTIYIDPDPDHIQMLIDKHLKK